MLTLADVNDRIGRRGTMAADEKPTQSTKQDLFIPAPAGGGSERANGRSKMAEELAKKLESEIMMSGWPVGQSLGSEAELIDRWEVSRAVFREAVRIVEHHGAARMRRGPGGGLIVTAPDPHAVVQAVTLCLDYENVSAADLLTTRSALELTCVRLAAESVDEDGIRRLRSLLEQEQRLGMAGVATGHPYELHIAIAEVTGNRAITLLVTILTRLMYERTGDLEFDSSEIVAVHQAHSSIVDAIISGDTALAQHRASRHLAASSSYYRPRNERSR